LIGSKIAAAKATTYYSPVPKTFYAVGSLIPLLEKLAAEILLWLCAISQLYSYGYLPSSQRPSSQLSHRKALQGRHPLTTAAGRRISPLVPALQGRNLKSMAVGHRTFPAFRRETEKTLETFKLF
jgi:hypothetical protein